MDIATSSDSQKPKQPLRSRSLARGTAARESTATSHLPFDQAATVVLGDLQHALLDLFAAAPSEIRKAADVERVFGINHLLGWQLYRIAHAQNPLAAGSHVPAKVSMKKLLTAAARRRIPTNVVATVASAFDAFERFAEVDLDGRDELDAILTSFVPEERHKNELLSRQSVFKGMSQIKGIAAQFDVAAHFFHPSSDGRSIDRVSLNCEIGLRRIRPDAPIILGSGDIAKSEVEMLTLDGRQPDGPMGAMLPQFSTSPLPNVEILRFADTVFHQVADREVGMRSAIDLVLADRRLAALPRFWQPGTPKYRNLYYLTDTPVKRMTLDVFMHRDVFLDDPPQLYVYDSVGTPVTIRYGDPAKEHHRLITQDVIRPLPRGVMDARLPHFSRYLEILDYIFATVGWNSHEFRCYRLDVPYPVYGGEYGMSIRMPEGTGERA